MLLLAWLACSSSPTTTDPQPPAPSPPATPSAERLNHPGRFSLPELVLGRPAALVVRDVPAGVEVTFWSSTAGEGSATVDGVRIDLVAPVALGAATAPAEGDLELVWEVPPDAEPGQLYVQGTFHHDGVDWFTDVTLRNFTVPAANSPVAFVLATEDAELPKLEMAGNSHTGGVAWIDYNGDYWPDLFVSNGGGRDHWLFRNDGDGTFTDVSPLVAKPDRSVEDAGAAFADLENDGDLDLLVIVDNPAFMNPSLPNPVEGGPNLLYVNQGDGTFAEAAAAWGVVDPRGWRTISGVFGDYDRDGLVDLYLGTWAMNREPLAVHDRYPRLLRNEGGATFVDRTAEAGLYEHGLDNLVTVWVDVDDDDWPDLYQGNVADDMYAPPEYDPTNYLYGNLGDGTFAERNAEWPGFGDDAAAAMGVDIGDYDADGDWDLYVTDIFDREDLALPDPQPNGNVLYDGDGAGGLHDNTCDVAQICTGYVGWPVNFADFDRDGWVDLWVGNVGFEATELLFLNERDGTFANQELPGFGENDPHGGSTADYDGDGDVDFFLHNTARISQLVRNEGKDEHGWVELKLLGTASNRAAIGAWVELGTGDGLLQRRRVSGGDSAHSQQDLILHFGLGDETEVDALVHWPSGAETALDGLTPGVLHFVDEDRGLLAEELLTATATYHATSGRVWVEARSSFGGRTGLFVEGLGALDWQPGDGTFFAKLDADAPTEVTVLSERGGRWTIPVALY